jgi:hypothetical protein
VGKFAHPSLYNILVHTILTKTAKLSNDLIQTTEDALAKFTQTIYLLAVPRTDIVECADELSEHLHVIPHKYKHDREGDEIAQCPPESKEYP